MAVELAVAYISLVAETDKLAPSIMKGTSGLNSTLEKRGGSLGGSLMKGIGGAAVGTAAVVAGGVVATLGAALVKGFGRLNSLDQASAKLRGLGNDAEAVEQVMSNALASVKGTAFGLDEAATTAANAVAAGVQPGADLGRYLGIIADTAAVAGVGLDDVGRVMNNVTTVGAAYNDSLQILAQKGLPIYTWLAEAAGTSEAAIKELASQGQISSEQLRSALESNVGGAALATGETFQGAMANMNASLGRIGANFLSPVFEQLAPTITAITDAMGPLETIAGDLGTKFGEFLVPLLETFRDMLAGGFDFTPFLELAGFLSPIGLAFQVLQPVLPQVMAMLSQVATVIGGALGTVLTAVLPILTSLVGIFAEFLAVVLPPLMPLITLLATTIGQLLVAVLPLLEPLLGLVGAILPQLAEFLGLLIPIIVQVVSAIADLMIPIVDTLVAVLGGLITFITGVFSGDWEKAWQGISDMFSGLWNGLGDIFTVVVNGWIDVLNGFLGALNEAGNFISDVTGGAIDINIPTIPHMAEGGTVLPRRGGTLAVLAEAGRAESVVDTGLLNRALEQGIAGPGVGGSGIVQNNNFAHEDPEVAVEMAGQRLTSLARRARV